LKAYLCPNCASRVFFENTTCLKCKTELGYVPALDFMKALPASAPATAPGVNTAGQPCANRSRIGCNWVVNPDVPAGVLCDCCRYTRVIPDLDQPGNLVAWRRLELAKHYLFYTLHALKLPIPDRTQFPETGLAFDFLNAADQKPVLTGHDKGVITVNIAEADDVVREKTRIAMHEPYRTLIGHLRHEVGHFYWDQLLNDESKLYAFRKLFGDERTDYAEALQKHYGSEDDGSWREQFISRYASTHPWEDWAETWAHYMHISDALDTAAAWQVEVAGVRGLVHPAEVAKYDSDEKFRERVLLQWIPLCQYLNATVRSLGEPDAYPFVLSNVVIDKLVFVHAMVRGVQVADATKAA
jgi:hypothetical protein